MGVYDTQTLRKYCSDHKGDILDVGYLMKHQFSHINPGSFRKFVSRLVSEGILYPLEKGIYTIGEIDEENINLVIYNHYTAMGMGIPLDNGLLWHLKMINDMPKAMTIVTTLSNGNRNIKGFYIQEIKGLVVGLPGSFVVLVNLFKLLKQNYGDTRLLIFETVQNMVKNMNSTVTGFYETAFEIFSRQDILSLANYLDKLHISNTVMQEYEQYMELHNNK